MFIGLSRAMAPTWGASDPRNTLPEGGLSSGDWRSGLVGKVSLAWGASQRVPGMKEGCGTGKKDAADGRRMQKDAAEGRRVQKDAAEGRRMQKDAEGCSRMQRDAAEGRRMLLFHGKRRRGQGQRAVQFSGAPADGAAPPRPG